MEAVSEFNKLFVSRHNESKDVNILSPEFYKKVIYNGPPETRSEEMMFRMLLAQMGSDFAIGWAFELSGVGLLKSITNPSKKVINKAISLDTSLYKDYKDQLTEEDLVSIVKMKSSELFGRPGWHLLYKLDPQPAVVIKAALDSDMGAMAAVKEQSVEYSEYCILNDNCQYWKLDLLKVRSPKVEQKILEKVIEGKWEFKFLCKELMTYDLAAKALAKPYNCDLQHIRDDLIDEHLIKIVLSNSNLIYNNARFIPDRFKTLEVCRKMVKMSSSYIKHVPSRYRLNEVTDNTFMKDKIAYAHLQNEYITSGLVKMIESFNTATKKTRFNFINDCTEEEILIILPYYPQMYRLIKKKTSLITSRAVSLDGWNIQDVPDDQYSVELYEIAIASRPGAIKHKRHN